MANPKALLWAAKKRHPDAEHFDIPLEEFGGMLVVEYFYPPDHVGRFFLGNPSDWVWLREYLEQECNSHIFYDEYAYTCTINGYAEEDMRHKCSRTLALMICEKLAEVEE